MTGEQDIFRRPQRRIQRRNLRRKNVQPGAAQPALVQGFGQRLGLAFSAWRTWPNTLYAHALGVFVEKQSLEEGASPGARTPDARSKRNSPADGAVYGI